MNPLDTNLPLSVESAPDRAEADYTPLLAGLYASDRALPGDLEAGAAALRARLLERAGASRAAEAGMFTARRRRLPRVALGDGVSEQHLYAAEPGRPLRPGEPLQARLIELAPGARLTPELLGPAAQSRARHRECLVVSGAIECGAERLSQRDYHVTPAGHEAPTWTSPSGALLFLRESDHADAGAPAPFALRDAEAGWPAFAPGIQRRVLWQHGGQAALLYYAQPGAQVPQHRHGHDEECLMLQGELFLDDLLLLAGDYQLAPAGSGHRITQTDTGVVIYAHGDLDLDFVA